MAGGSERSFSGQGDLPDQIKQEPVQEEPCEERTEVESGEGDDSNCALDKDVKEEVLEDGEILVIGELAQNKKGECKPKYRPTKYILR